MRRITIAMLAFVAACTKPNPNVCCVTDTQCADLGADELRPCDVGQACAADFTCVAAECTTSVDCTSPDAPICANGLCIGACTGDADCADVAGRPYCSPDSACVGCLDASQCTADAAICDPDTHACRGCERDDECASGVCIEADGMCADESAILWVRMFGTDNGTCTEAAPCETLDYAIGQASPSRNVIRVTGGMLAPASVHVTRAVTIDGTGTTLPLPFNGNLIEATSLGLGAIVIEGLQLQGSPSATVSTIAVGNGATVVLARGTTVSGGDVRVSGGTLNAADVSFENAQVTCTTGSLNVATSILSQSTIYTTDCQASIIRSRFERSADPILGMSGGVVAVENNLFVQGYELTDSLNIAGVAPSSHFWFNTVVNVSGVVSDGIALHCDATLDVSSNVFAYQSAHPMGPPGGGEAPCASRYSIFDPAAVESHRTGVGNLVVPYAEIFGDVGAGDFGLRSGGQGNDAAETGLSVLTDIDGRRRSATPDIGAFEAP